MDAKSSTKETSSGVRFWRRSDRILVVLVILPVVASTALLLASLQLSRSPTTGYKTDWHFFRARSGSEQEYVQLFLRNTFPVLLEQAREGGIRSVHLHRSITSIERERWTLVVVIEYPTSDSKPQEPPAELVRRLVGDRQTYLLEKVAEAGLIETQWNVSVEEMAGTDSIRR